MKIPFLKIFVSILLVSSLILNFFLYQKLNQNLPGEKVLGVLDGDTVVLEQDVKVRLRHLDAPELQFCGGEEAKKILEKLVLGKKVTIQEQIIDNYGRPMGLVYNGSTLINLEMLKSGWVRYHSDKTTKTEALKAAADEAKNKGLGVYGSLCSQTTNLINPKCNIKGNLDKNSTKKLYYLPNCAQYNFTIVEKDLGENWFCTEIEAQKAGFTKAATCY